MHYANDAERLVAEQAVLNFRELRQVMKTAPHGKAMAVLELAVREKGFEQMRQTLKMLAGAHEEAQKRGQPPALFLRRLGLFQGMPAQNTANRGGRGGSEPAVLFVP